MNGKPWLSRELALLVDFKEVKKFGWKEIAAALDRTAQACQVRYSCVMLERRRAAGLAKPIRKRRAMIDYPCKVSPRIAAPPSAAAPTSVPSSLVPTPGASGRAVHTSTLMIDAELRGRIALVGITAGLLGDPLPGRSALDRKRAGEAL